MTALMAATNFGHSQIVDSLLKAGANPNLRRAKVRMDLLYNLSCIMCYLSNMTPLTLMGNITLYPPDSVSLHVMHERMMRKCGRIRKIVM